MTLLTPGPVMTSLAVRQAAARPDMNHREPEFIAMNHHVRESLLSVYGWGQAAEAFVIGGSGTSAMEAMATSCVVKGPVLIIADGYFSERMATIFEIHRIPHRTLAMDWLRSPDLDRIASELASEQFEAVAVAQCETTAGRLNPIEEIADLARQHGAKVLVDAISSFGAEALSIDSFDAACSTANKALHGLPGVSFVFVRRRALLLGEVPRRTYYLHLPMYASDTPPLTAPVPLLASLKVALEELGNQGGWEKRRAQYRSRTLACRKSLAAFGARLLLDERDSACVVTAAELPEPWSADTFLDANRKIGFQLYGCKGQLAEKCIQVGHMGEIPDAELERWQRSLAGLVSPPQNS